MTTSATAREEFVDVAGSRLHVAIAGSGEPIVVLHQDIGSPGIDDPFVPSAGPGPTRSICLRTPGSISRMCPNGRATRATSR